MSRATIVFCIFLMAAYVSARPGPAEASAKKEIVENPKNDAKDLDTASSYYSGYGYYGGLYPSYYSGLSYYPSYSYGHGYGYPLYGGYGGLGYGGLYGHGYYGGHGLW